MKEFLAEQNQGLSPENWKIACCRFAPYAPQENPVEAIWLQLKTLLRRFYRFGKIFKIVKRLFQLFVDFQLFIDWAIANSTYNKNKAHKELYHPLRRQYPSVPSALLQTVRDNALEAIKATNYQQEQFLTYKAEALGKRVVHQDPRYTSQKCNVCKHIKRTNRNKSRFCCKNCGHKTHADLNAARNVRDDYILSSTQNGTEEQVSVNVPDVSDESNLI